MCFSLKASWGSLRTEFSSLSPAQLHHMLREYSPRRPCPSAWTPCSADADAACRTGEQHSDIQWWYCSDLLSGWYRQKQVLFQLVYHSFTHWDFNLLLWKSAILRLSCVITILFPADILESFDDHPPLVLPIDGFHLNVKKPIGDTSLIKELVQLQAVIKTLNVAASAVESDQVCSNVY